MKPSTDFNMSAEIFLAVKELCFLKSTFYGLWTVFIEGVLWNIKDYFKECLHARKFGEH
jgi:hypothetical protein